MFITDDDIQRGVDYRLDNIDTAAAARAHRQYLEKYTNSLKALIMKEHPNLAANAQEREALADDRFLKHLKALEVAIFEDEKHRFRLEAEEAKLAAWQTMHKVELAMKI